MTQRGTASWTVYADNCGGQNKNNHLVRFFQFLVDSGRLRSASLYFLIKGHTKNNCDRGFALIKRAYAKRDLYTMEHVRAVVENSAESNSCVSLENANGVFLDWKTALQTIYGDMKGIQSYQMFNMSSSNPGVVSCRKRPTATPVEQKLAKGATVDWNAVWDSLKAVPACGPNPEKVSDLHQKILPYIPDEFKTDDLYRAPTLDESKAAEQRKKRRRKTTPRLAEQLFAAQESEEKHES